MAGVFFFMIIKQAHSDLELQGILELQRLNLPQNISNIELQEEGFVTVEHDFDLLKKMNDELAASIAIDNNKVIGYSLAMSKKFSDDIPVLIPMFELIDSLDYKDHLLGEIEYIIGGQVCIDKAYRSRGIFYKLYDKSKKHYSDRFPVMLTEVSKRNPRSIKAHLNLGFESIHEYETDQDKWVIMAWNWSL